MERIYLSFDLEEWRIPEHNGIKSKYNANTSFSYKGTLRLLGLLKKHSIKVTFFVTGYFAQKRPGLIKKIIKEGHEIASHGYKDGDYNKLMPEEIREGIMKTTKILTRITGKKPLGFRTPQFSVNDTVLREIIKEGYSYDSSIHPTIIPRYKNDYPKKQEPYILELSSNEKIKEIPASVMPLIRGPISWVWMRNIGMWWTKLGMKLNLRAGRSAVIYLHPWEFVNLPKIGGVPSYITRNCGNRFLKKLEGLIKSFKKYEFGLIKDMETKAKSKVEHYFDTKAVGYNKSRRKGLVGGLVLRESEAALELLNVKKGESVLDCGCGAGFYGIKIKRLGGEYLGVDISEEMVEQAKKNGLKARIADIQSFRGEKKLDKILISSSIEFCKEPGKAVHNCSKNLRKGGLLVATFPRLNPIGILYYLFHLQHGFKIKLYSLKEIKKFLSRGGFKIKSTKRPNSLVYVVLAKK